MGSTEILETRKIIFSFYGDLKRFLSNDRQKKGFTYSLKGRPTIKDTIEALGVPHTEVDAIIANGQPVDFHYRSRDQDHVSVYPDAAKARRSNIIKLKPEIPSKPTFICDVHLGKLCRYLRLCGFDTLYDQRASDQQMIRTGVKEKRILLTRDIGLLKNNQIYFGYFVRHIDPQKRIKEVVRQFRLRDKISPFKICTKCNGRLKRVAKKDVLDQLPPKVKKYYRIFHRCSKCKKVYWKGSHYERLQEAIDQISKP